MPPNVVVIVIDALRADRVGALDGRELTPNIDQFAENSARFSNAFSTSNATDVAITSIQTGRYPLSHGVLNHGKHVTKSEKQKVENISQLPEVLSDNGYQTAKFGRPLGRWHRNGFDRYPTKMESRVAFDRNEGDGGNKAGQLLEQIHPRLRTVARNTKNEITDLLSEDDKKISGATDIGLDKQSVVNKFEAFIDDSANFYSFIHLMDTHAPYGADPDVVVEYLNKYDYDVRRVSEISQNVPEKFHELIQDGAYPEIRQRYYFDDGSPCTAIVDAHYDAAVSEADERVGDIIDVMKSRDIYDDTLTIVLSDHGESLTEHGIYYDHHGLYDVSTRVPLFVRPPGGCSTTTSDLVQIIDIAPTIEAYVGSDEIQSDGQSLKPIIEDKESIRRDHVLAEEAHTQRRRMLRTPKEKLIYSLDGDTVCRYCDVQHAPENELYNLVEDPTESKNVAGEQQNRVSEVKELANAITSEFEARCPSPESDSTVEYEDEEAVQERLEALGYR